MGGRIDKGVAVAALHDALAILGEPATKELLAILKDHYRIGLSKDEPASKEDIETALKEILGRGGSVMIMLWNEKIDEKLTTRSW